MTDQEPTHTAPLDDLISFLDASPSPRHAVESAIGRLGGFDRLDEAAAWDEPPAAGYVVRGGALIAWRIPDGAAPNTPFRMAGAHTDSPCLRIKPRPDVASHGWQQLGIEVYGGILNNSWLDRDLALAGYVVDIDGHEHLVDVREPLARVPQLAIHLDREVNSKGLVLDAQRHLTPVWGIGEPAGGFAAWLADRAGLDRPPTWWELCLYDVQGASVLGHNGSLLASGRLDNLLSCWAATRALADADPVDHIAVIVLNDHEEVGSSSTTGASGPFLESVLARLVSARGGSDDDRYMAYAGSACISADNAHAVHPNYAERHEPAHAPAVNAGPALKINANQRYATSASTAAMFQRSCEAAGVPWQVFVSRNNMPCGSTIGPLTATRLGIPTADVGVPQLSMHSARELCGSRDPEYLRRALIDFLS
ncbi:MAG: M18 family aminopeptidase [Acidimicrobiia bacterium]|nr:M18 family aminopeptidase [Acidimicrobiia bacterium]